MDGDEEHRAGWVLRVLSDALELVGDEIAVGEVEGHGVVEDQRLFGEEDMVGGRADLRAGRQGIDRVGVLEVVGSGRFPLRPTAEIETEAVSHGGVGLGDACVGERPDR